MSKNLLLVLASLLFCVFGGEIILRIGGYYMPPPDPPPCVYYAPNCALYEASDAFGYHLKPSRNITYRYPLYASFGRVLSMNSNRHGFRNSREFEQPDPRFRILVTGDSQAFGEGVEENERFSNLIEAAQPDWRVDNLAMPGYGPDLMLRALERVKTSARPDAVVLSFFSDDFHRLGPYYAGIGFRVPHYELRGGELVSAPYPPLNLFTRVRLWQAYQQIMWKVSGGEMRMNQAILDRFCELSRRDRFQFLVLLFPTRRPSDVERSQIRWLEEYCRLNGIPYRDASEALAREPYSETLIPQNSHFNPRGHKVIAHELHQLLREAARTRTTHAHAAAR